jgi:sensor histidine kinase YesM
MSGDLFNKRSSFYWILTFVFITLIGLMNFSIVLTEKNTSGRSIPFQYPFIDEMTGAYSVYILLPFLLWFFKRFPIKRKNLVTFIPLHLFISVCFGITHTMLMGISRKLIYSLAGMGTYDFGLLGYRLIMEYHKQFLIYWFIYGIVALIRFVKKNHEQKLKTSQLEQKLTKARLEALQMQLNPHFLFNTLNMISSTMYENITAADKMITRLSDLLRLTLKSKKLDQYTLKEELKLLQLYIEIMKARFGDKLVVGRDIEEKTLNAIIPVFILQPIVENAIKHSLEKTTNTTEIKIKSWQKKDRLMLQVRDNGPGISPDSMKFMKNGIGITNSIERLEKFYGSNYRFNLDNIDAGGVQVIIEIPFKLGREVNQ